MFEWIVSPEAWVALATLTALEIVLGIDNVIFIAILVDRLPPEQRRRGRLFGLALAMLTRVALLFSLAFLASLTSPWVTLYGREFSGRDAVLIAGGLFLLFKATIEIQANVEGDDEQAHVAGRARHGFLATLVQIAVIDVVFSLDSVITAVGMVQHLEVMVIAIVVSVLFMMLASGAIAAFVNANPTLKVLALSFLILIGVALVGEGFDLHIPKAYIYFAMGFSVTVEMLNTRRRRKLAQRKAARETAGTA
ncbi:MAG: TerC family protein [Burkholderiales bacterium]|nr:TerC family protein [Burkholderiales bacterium]